MTVIHIKDFLRIKDIDLIFAGLKALENTIWEQASETDGLDQDYLKQIDQVKIQLLKHIEHKEEPKPIIHIIEPIKF